MNMCMYVCRGLREGLYVVHCCCVSKYTVRSDAEWGFLRKQEVVKIHKKIEMQILKHAILMMFHAPLNRYAGLVLLFCFMCLVTLLNSTLILLFEYFFSISFFHRKNPFSLSEKINFSFQVWTLETQSEITDGVRYERSQCGQ